MRPLLLLCFVYLCMTLSSCGGGGGSDGGTDSGSISMQITPNTVEEGSLSFLTVRFNQADFDDLDSQGITVKLLIPTELSLVANSTTLTLKAGGVPITPLQIIPVSGEFAEEFVKEKGLLESGDSVGDGEFTMYVFPLSAELLDDEDDGLIQATFQVTGVPPYPVYFSDIDRGAITSFSLENADFDAESSGTFIVTPTADE